VQRLERQHHDQTVFIGTIAHELRNPPQPIGLATRLLALSVDPKQIEQAAKVIRRQVAFVERLVEDLVDMTRVGEGRLNLRYEDVLLQPLVEEAIEACRPSAVAASVELLSVLPPVMVRVQVDSSSPCTEEPIEVRSEGRGRGSEFIARLPILRQAPRTPN
jgi:two-component system CheB/CheR fusion protein